MDVVLVALHVAFFVPVAIRAGTQKSGDSGRSKGLSGEIAAGLGRPAMLVHGTGLVLMWAAVLLAVARGHVPRGIDTSNAVATGILVLAVVLMAWSVLALRS